MDTIKKNLDNITNNNVNYIFLSFIIVFLILFSFFTWLFNKLRLQGKDKHCKEYRTADDNDQPLLSAKKIEEGTKLSRYIPSSRDSNRTDLFKNYYYFTAYNCCSGRNYKNNWVNQCALDKAILMGVRCLDFEIYSLFNEPIISTSTTKDDEYTVKETYNYIRFDDAMRKIAGRGQSMAGNNRGPIILLLRIKSLNKIIYDKMGLILYNKFYKKDYNNSQLLPYPFNYRFINNTSARLYTTPLIELKDKIIIAVYSDYNKFNDTNLSYVTNMKVENQYGNKNTKAIIYRYDELMAKGQNNKQLINDSKSNFIFVLPSINNSNKNMDAILPFSNGCQCIAMKLQFYDNNLASYYNLFKTINKETASPYALKQPSKRKDKEGTNIIVPGDKLLEVDLIDYFSK